MQAWIEIVRNLADIATQVSCFNNILKCIYFLFLSNTNSSHRKYTQGFKKGKSYCIIRIKFTK